MLYEMCTLLFQMCPFLVDPPSSSVTVATSLCLEFRFGFFLRNAVILDFAYLPLVCFAMSSVARFVPLYGLLR